MGDAAVYDAATIRAERDALRAELAAVLSDWNAIVAASGSPTNGGAIGHVRALAAEVVKLRAACAAKDAALSKALGYVDFDNPDLISKCLAALKDDAGKGWIDASGAVESMALPVLEDGNAWVDDTPLPAAWVGKSVLIVVKP